MITKCDKCGDESNSQPDLTCGRLLGLDERGEETREPACDGTYRALPLCPSWGMPASIIPQGSRLAWGGRAIYRLTDTRKRHGKGWRSVTVAEIDLPWDRQDTRAVEGVPDAERAAFGKWINQAGLPELRKKLAADYITTDSEDVITFASDGFAIAASPRGSYGYLYITAWRVER